MSAGGAKQSEEEAFVPPPRRIDDIIKILDQAGNFAGNTESYRKRADAPPPAGRSKEGLAAFYRDRAIAAYQLGRSRQALEDFAMARDCAGKAAVHDHDFLLRFGQTEVNAGNFQRGIQIFEENIKKHNDTITYWNLVSAYALIGDIDNAKKTRQDGLRSCRSELLRERRPSAGMAALCGILEANTEASILEAQGKYKEAEKHIRAVIDAQIAIGAKFISPTTILTLKTWLAGNLFRQGRFFESEVIARDVLKEALAHGGQQSTQTLSVIVMISSNLAAQGRTEDAEKLLSAAIRLLEASGVTNDSAMAAQVRVDYGGLLAAQGNFKGAMEQFDLVKAGMQGNRYLYEKRYARNESLLLSLIFTGRTEEAIGLIKDNYESFRNLFGENHTRTAEMLALRAMAHSRTNNPGKAAEDFAASMKVLMGQASDTGGYVRRQRIKIIIQDYMRSLDRIRATPLEAALNIDAAALSFRLSEATRSQSVQSALLANSARAAEQDPETVSLIRKEQDTLKEIDVLEASILEMMSAPPDQQNPQLTKQLHAKLEHLRKTRSAMLDEILKRSPKYAGFVNPQPPLPSSVRERLYPHEALISIFSLDDRTYVWAIPHTGKVAFASIAVPKKELDAIVTALRGALDPKPSTLTDIPPYDTDRAYQLYSKLLLPVREGWKDAHDFLVIANDPVSRMPLDVLTTAPSKPLDEKLLFDGYRKVPWLIEQVSITMVPSASSLISLRTLPPGPSHRKAFAGFGDPIFNPEQMKLAQKETNVQVRGVRITSRGGIDTANATSNRLENLERLPDTADEIRSIAATLKADVAHDIFLGKEASETKVKSMNLSDRQVISFATHALLPGDLDGLDQPALALSSPTVTGNKEDGLLTTSEIMKLKLNADWVVLSACETGGAEGSDKEALSGLGRAFFYAGTRAVLATMYPIETTSAKKLMIGLFREQNENEQHTRAQALRKAMLDLIADPGIEDPSSKKLVASCAHPFFWAPFVLFGDGGRAPAAPRN